jgi:flagellar basal-body rod protein FlgF
MVANNLANVDTGAFKKDAPTFKQYMANVEREHGTVDIPRGPIKDKDLYPLDGRDQAFVTVDGTYTNFKQGNLRVTQAPLDVALDGPGFLEVSTPNGIRYTRQGSLKVATDGRLVTSDGNPVLISSPGGPAAQGGLSEPTPADQGRSPAAQGGAGPGNGEVSTRFLNLRDRGNITINGIGEVYAGDDLVGRLSVVEFNDARRLRKQGGSLFVNPDPLNVSAQPQRTQVRQGVLEGSNVNPVEEMTNLIRANRAFEQDLKAMKTYNDLMGREANDIGKL